MNLIRGIIRYSVNNLKYIKNDIKVLMQTLQKNITFTYPP